MALKMQNAAPAAAEDTDKKKPGGKPKLMVIVAAAVVLIGAIAGVFVVKAQAAKKANAGPTVLKVGEIVPLDEFMLNLADTSSDHYVKTTVALGLTQGITADQFKDKVPQSRDAIIMVLSAKHLADLQTESGKIALKKQIQESVNTALGEKDVAAVYFQDFATQ
jgi:flagellar FliL protein